MIMSGDSLLTTGEFSVMTGIPASTLIHYDKEGLFHPAKRGENGFRYYSPVQAVSVKLISALKNCGVPLAVIKDVMQKRTPETLLSLLLQQKEEIPLELSRLQEALDVIHVFTGHISEGLSVEAGRISVQYLNEERYARGQINDFSDGNSFYGAFQRYCADAARNGGNLSYPVGGWWSGMEQFLRSPVRPEHYFSVDPNGGQSKPAGRYLVGYARCFYGNIDDLPEQMAAYAQQNDLRFDGPVYNVFVLDEVSTADPDQYLLRVSVMVK
jgi:DNA-binding transcriptional MerR regulator